MLLSLLVLVAPLVSALTISAPTNVTSGGVFTIRWTSATGDPDTWSFELTNPAFNNAIAISNNVDPSLGSLTLQCPIVAAGGAYTIQAVNIGNINQVYAETPIFSIGETITSSGSVTSSTASGTASTQTGIVTTANSPVTTSISLTTTPTGASTLAGTGTSVTTAASTTPSTASAASLRLALTNAGGYAVLMLSAVAGAAAIAL